MRALIFSFRFLPLYFIFFGSMAQEAIYLDDRRELFVDQYLIANLNKATIRMHQPVDMGKVLEFDRPWEGAFSAYVTIIEEDGLFRTYYRGVPTAGKDGNSAEVTCYAESRDGVHWRKPDLGIYEVNGSKENNVILANAAPVTHNFSPFLDSNPTAKPAEKFKALGGTSESGLVAFTSADGINWTRLQEEPVFSQGVFDSQNVAFWSESESQYVCYFRSWTGKGYKGFRSVSRTTSKDFVHWTEPEPMGFGDTPYEHLYTQQTSPYFRAPHIYLAIGARFMPDRQVVSDAEAEKLGVNPKYYNDCSDVFLMSSRGGNQYVRQFMESFIRPGIGLQNWVSRSNYPALNVVQTGETEMSIYVNQDYAQPSAHLRRYALRLDGFASLSAGYEGGEMISKPFIFEGEQLEVNYSTSAAGEIRIELLDGFGNKLPGYSMEEAQPVIGNEISRFVFWNNSSDVSDLAGNPVRMRVYLKDADLYSFRFK
ncbi:hypothetical protein SAMN04488057_11412 [Cyclobacterium lianum]|uniref:Glycosyl hydrolases family 32 N-terminal domain-containing protein n=1 Tax=Cyclobacterium lianum TaxID=388280 RepID=A0A1M7Q4Y8_9BACT|nr:hypothetical protein [Cyclobacterium lianum]SHN25331.1 hypothetical protein SAMN04488057_11412 [Cyclobacterium lianum]